MRYSPCVPSGVVAGVQGKPAYVRKLVYSYDYIMCMRRIRTTYIIISILGVINCMHACLRNCMSSRFRNLDMRANKARVHARMSI